MNKGFRYLLVCIDIFTRMAYVEPMRGKTIKDAEQAFLSIIKRASKPKVVISDQEGAFQSNQFEAMMKQFGIIINVNALGDHRALGIIDRFARTLKTIITKTFIDHNTTVWIDRIQSIINTYNNKHQQSAIADKTPNQAMMTKNTEDIRNINVAKNQFNKTVSDLSVGDHVRKEVIFNDRSLSKGTDPRWSDEVYDVIKVSGQTIYLNDNTKYKRHNLLKVPSDAISTPANPINTIKKAKRAAQQK